MKNENDYEISDLARHVREHPELCYGKVGNGTEYDDCIYCMLQEVMDNAVDEFRMGYGVQVDVNIDYASGEMSVRDYGRGAPLRKLDECFGCELSSVGMWPSNDIEINSHDLVAMSSVRKVCALSARLIVRSVRDGDYGEIVFERGRQISFVHGTCNENEQNGTHVRWIPDIAIFRDYTIVEENVVRRIANCAKSNPGLKFVLNGKEREGEFS